MSFFKKIGKGLKKVIKKIAPIAAVAAPFLPGVGGLIGTAVNKIGGLFSAKDGAQSFPVRSEGDPPPQESGGFWSTAGQMLKDATPAIVGGLNYYGQQQTNAANAKQAQQQMDFQNQQTSTSYQRGVADMKAAGLNPMLAYSQGGAGSGGGAMATMGNEVGAGANSALSAQMTMQQLKGMVLQNEQQQAEIRRTDADTDYIRARRLDTLEGIPTHAVNRAGTEQGTKHKYQLTSHQELLNNLLTDSYKDQLNMFSSAVRAKDAEADLTSARIGEARGCSRVAEGFGNLIGEGTDTINSAKDWLGQHLGGWLPTPYDIQTNIDRFRNYGKRN